MPPLLYVGVRSVPVGRGLVCRGVRMGSRWWRFMDEQWLCDMGECVRLKVLLLLHCSESPYLAAGLCWMVCAGGGSL